MRFSYFNFFPGTHEVGVLINLLSLRNASFSAKKYYVKCHLICLSCILVVQILYCSFCEIVLEIIILLFEDPYGKVADSFK